MGKALVIKNVNFEANKLATIEFNEIDCTGVSVSPASIDFTSIGATQGLTVIKTPSNTTDSVIYESSDTNVCTVSNGTVTCTGIGTATITVRCGLATASCYVSVQEIVYNPMWKTGKSSVYNNTMPIIGDAASDYIFAAKSIETGNTQEIFYLNHSVYAMEIPEGCSDIKITMDEYIGNYMHIVWLDSTSKPYANFPTCLEGQRVTGITILENGNVLSVPEGKDKFVICVQTDETHTQYADMTSVANEANITISALLDT